MMKRFIALALVLCLAICLFVACTGDETPAADGSAQEQASDSSETQEESGSDGNTETRGGEESKKPEVTTTPSGANGEEYGGSGVKLPEAEL